MASNAMVKEVRGVKDRWAGAVDDDIRRLC
jgi:hypothetical protein